MDFNKFWKQFKKEAALDKLIDALDELKSISIAASKDAKAAEDAYYANARKKEEKVAARVAKLNEQRIALQAKIGEYKYPLTNATANGDTDALDKIRSAMRALEAEKAQVVSEIELLESAYIRGDDTLYKAVELKNNRFLELKNAVLEAGRMIERDQYLEKRFEKITTFLHYFTCEYTCGTSLGAGANMEKLNNHYNAEQLAEQRKMEVAKMIEQKAARSNVVEIAQRIDSDRRAVPGYDPEFYREESAKESSSVDSSISADGKERPQTNGHPQRNTQYKPSNERLQREKEDTLLAQLRRDFT